jgi:Fe-Mn family superoxide dismutase
MYSLPDLNYKYNALEPYIDAETMEIHYTKHHQAYIDKLNAILDKNTNLKDKPLEELAVLPETKDFAGGHLNHSFFWKILNPIAPKFNSSIFKTYKDEFVQKSTTFFGSGWVWLVEKGSEYEVITTQNQDSPIAQKRVPVLGIDLWEHAYYLKYQNRRVDYINAWINLVIK